MNFPRNYFAKAGPEAIFYAAMVLATSVFVSRELGRQGLVVGLAGALPLLCLLLIVSRWHVFAATVPAALFFSLGTIGITGIRMAGGELSLSLGSLGLLAAVARFQTCTARTGGSVATSRWNTTPMPKVMQQSRFTWHVSKLVTLAICLIAWLLAGLACAELTEISTNRQAYLQYLEDLRADWGLEIPEVYIGMKLLIGMALISWLARAIFIYQGLVKAGGELSSIHLRSELWKWNGSEQRMISKQLKKNQV